jgi:hypothetical protein
VRAKIARSTFADANAQRPSAVFEALCAALAAQAGRGLAASSTARRT